MGSASIILVPTNVFDRVVRMGRRVSVIRGFYSSNRAERIMYVYRMDLKRKKKKRISRVKDACRYIFVPANQANSDIDFSTYGTK